MRESETFRLLCKKFSTRAVTVEYFFRMAFEQGCVDFFIYFFGRQKATWQCRPVTIKLSECNDGLCFLFSPGLPGLPLPGQQGRAHDVRRGSLGPARHPRRLRFRTLVQK